MYPILLAHEDPFLRSYIAEKLQFMFDVDSVDTGQAVMSRVQCRSYFAVIVGAAFKDVNARGLSVWMQAEASRRPRLLILIRDKPQFASDKDVSTFENAITLSLPAQTQELIDVLSRNSRILDREKWSRLSPLQKDLIDTHLTIFRNLQTGSVEKVVVSETFAKGIDLLVETSRGHMIEEVLETMKDYDDYTFSHQMSVASLLTLFGIEVGIPQKDLRILAQAGVLHDVDKREIPLTVLHKPGPLNPAEWAVMKDHVRFSMEILGQIEGLSKHVINVAAQHHEKLDGTGYPFGLKANEIDDLSLVCSVADIFSALSEKRPYKSSKTRQEALAIMEGLTGSHIDKGIFGHFRSMILRSEGYRQAVAA